MFNPTLVIFNSKVTTLMVTTGVGGQGYAIPPPD
jgi:hypothetical protein